MEHDGGGGEERRRRHGRPSPPPSMPMARRPSLAHSLDGTSSGALPILGWDAEEMSDGSGTLPSSRTQIKSNDNGNAARDSSSFLVRTKGGEDEANDPVVDHRRTRRKISRMGSSTFRQSMMDPRLIVGCNGMFEDFVLRGDSRHDGRPSTKFDEDDAEEDDDDAIRHLPSSLPSRGERPRGNGAGLVGFVGADHRHHPYSSRDVLKSMMMEEEYDSRKPWRT